MPPINPIKSAKNLREKLVRPKDSIKEYALASFKGTAMEKYFDESVMVTDFFRPFTPVEPSKHRKLNGSDFNMFKDTLFDYPIIIQSKLGGNWQKYNRLISIQDGGCNIRCWHCYTDDILRQGPPNPNVRYWTASEIVEEFLWQRERDSEVQKETNVLRISGGEPFLVPDLILDCLKRIEDIRKQKEIFIWSETNLSPFLKEDSKSLVEQWVELDELARHENFALHPCLHGIDPISLYQNSNVDGAYFSGLLDGLKILIEHNIDIYPTFGSNVCPPKALPELFKKLVEIDENLPLRFALIEFDLSYEQVIPRIKESSGKYYELYSTSIYNKFRNIQICDDLLFNKYGKRYAEKRRHTVKLGG